MSKITLAKLIASGAVFGSIIGGLLGADPAYCAATGMCATWALLKFIGA